MTLADICLFTTLIRFDVVYSVLFKCTKKKLVEYSNLHGYLRDIYQVSILTSWLLIYLLAESSPIVLYGIYRTID